MSAVWKEQVLAVLQALVANRATLVMRYFVAIVSAMIFWKNQCPHQKTAPSLSPMVPSMETIMKNARRSASADLAGGREKALESVLLPA